MASPMTGYYIHMLKIELDVDGWKPNLEKESEGR
jgi:hypothetical protein